MSTMDTLRTELFGAIKDLRAGKLDTATAKSVSELAQTIINTAKAEADYARATGRQVVSALIPMPDDAPTRDGSTPTRTGIKTVSGHRTVHRIA